jgi:putative FmdB family regulatory protein
MPLYEYFCKNCGKRFDKMMRFSEASSTVECPYCSSRETSKQISTFASVGAAGSGGSQQAQPASSCSSQGRFR